MSRELSAEAWVVKQILNLESPTFWRRSGPGVRARYARAWFTLSRRQRAIARAEGWERRSWIDAERQRYLKRKRRMRRAIRRELREAMRQ